MSDIVGSTNFRNILADKAAELYYWVTLHAFEGNTLNVDDFYTVGCHAELGTAGGYVQGGKPVNYQHLLNNGLLTAASVSWQAEAAGIGLAFYAACWVSETNDITTAKLLWVNDMSVTPQMATFENMMTVSIGQNLTVPVPV